MARRSIWTRAKHRVGLERPHFCTRFRGQSDAWGRSSPRRDSFRCFARVCRRILRRNMCRKKARPTEFILKCFPTTTSAKVTVQKRTNRAHVFSPRAKQPRSRPPNSQVPVKWASPLFFTATSPATSPSIEHGLMEINQMHRPEGRNCARPRSRLRRERPHPLTHGASRLPCGRSRPHRNFVSAFCVVAYTDLRICQTRGLTLCMKTKGDARCLY